MVRLKKRISRGRIALATALLLALLLAVACAGGGAGDNGSASEQAGDADSHMLSLPQAEVLVTDGEQLRVVATTSIVGDVVRNVGGDLIDLAVLMGPGQDPHSYEPAAADLTAAARAHVIFVHGWDLEEGLRDDLSRVSEGALIVPVAANIEPLVRGEEDDGDEHEDDDEHGPADPHTWLDPQLVVQWVDNIESILAAADPANGEAYAANAGAYREELAALIATYDEQLAQIPPQRRKLVTNHDALAYFAKAYDFEVVGTVIPGSSTLAEPSASGLAGLVRDMEQAGVCTIFTETTVSAQLAQTAADELTTCDEVQVVPLYTGAIGDAESGAGSYIEMMRANVEAIVQGLGQ
ncbi:MAG TPA: metal ABC transporter substrate-binding protein [Candidatus Sulfomarinibacteraceae bacterium]|nr:metal ABC transporter substrate-binding protein [Candidatus Sulfomarinibacteraceae bacterium]